MRSVPTPRCRSASFQRLVRCQRLIEWNELRYVPRFEPLPRRSAARPARGTAAQRPRGCCPRITPAPTARRTHRAKVGTNAPERKRTYIKSGLNTEEKRSDHWKRIISIRPALRRERVRVCVALGSGREVHPRAIIATNHGLATRSQHLRSGFPIWAP